MLDSPEWNCLSPPSARRWVPFTRGSRERHVGHTFPLDDLARREPYRLGPIATPTCFAGLFAPLNVGETGHRPGGTRTHNLRIKSPLLFQLSYEPIRGWTDPRKWMFLPCCLHPLCMPHGNRTVRGKASRQANSCVSLPCMTQGGWATPESPGYEPGEGFADGSPLAPRDTASSLCQGRDADGRGGGRTRVRR